MGGSSSPLLADLFLAHCEFTYMKRIIADKKFGLAKLLSRTSRYIDRVAPDKGFGGFNRSDPVITCYNML